MLRTVFLYFVVPFILVSLLCVGCQMIYISLIRESIYDEISMMDRVKECFDNCLALIVTIPVATFILLYLKMKNVDTIIENDMMVGIMEKMCDSALGSFEFQVLNYI
ncbi:hypothetical protein WDU94_013143 [Cyamophila willieti]